MRRLFTMTLPLLLALAGCIGGLTNDPFTAEGIITGRVEGAEAGVHVIPVGRPELGTVTDDTGGFRIEGLPAGPATLVATDTVSAAARIEVLVVGGEERQTQLVLADAARVVGQITFSGDGELTPARVGITGLPLEVLTDSEWRFELGGIPPGTWQLYAEHDRYLRAMRGIDAVTGGTRQETMHLRAQDEEGGLCDSCTTGADCLSGICHTEDHSGEIIETFCAVACDAGSCPSGYRCESVAGEGEVCIPSAGSCVSVEKTGESCTTDADCSLEGLGDGKDGLCVEGTCTVPCGDDSDCAQGTCDATLDVCVGE